MDDYFHTSTFISLLITTVIMPKASADGKFCTV